MLAVCLPTGTEEGVRLKRKKKRVGLLTKLLLAAFAVYAAFQLVELQLECAELEDAIQDGDHADYIAKVARESLGYVYPGEQVFVDISSK